MFSLFAFVICALFECFSCDLDFPPDFKFGAASSSFQIEGGWEADGKTRSIWDEFVHKYNGDIKDNSTGDVSANSYSLWREDVRVAREIGLQFYRFSICWPRILPNGFADKINQAGVKYYSDLIDALLAEGIEPVVTLYHWEMPVVIQDLGGWTNPLIVDWFGDYARVIYSLYADRVKTWLTINEPFVVCDIHYPSVFLPKRIKDPLNAPLLCNKYILLAHAKAYRIYEQEFKPKYNGRMSIANFMFWLLPTTPEDIDRTEYARQLHVGRYSHAIFSKEGGWPSSVEKLMMQSSITQGLNQSRLLPFTSDEIEFIKGTADFYALIYYTTRLVRLAKSTDPVNVPFVTGLPEMKVTVTSPPDAPVTFDSSSIYPKGLRGTLKWLKEEYGDLDIMIVENGIQTKGYRLKDDDRIDYIKQHLEQVLLAINEDDVNVTGYTVWSLIDNFEWTKGYTSKFGLCEVNFDDPGLPRTRRLSSYFYECVIKHKSLNFSSSCFDNILN